MKPKCQAQVRSAAAEIGREGITDAELNAIDGRMRAKMRELAGTDEHWQTYSADQRLSLAAKAAIADIRDAAARKVQNAELQVLKTVATEDRVTAATADKDGVRSRGLVEDIDKTSHYIQGVKMESVGGLMNLVDAVKSGKGASLGRRVAMFLFDSDNPHMTRAVAEEIFSNADGSSGNKVAQKGAEAYLKVIEDMRQRFNAGGGDVGRLEYGYIPQPHDAAKVRGKDTPAARAAWVESILPRLRRERYLNEDGSRMNDAQVREVMGAAWETLSTDGLNKVEPGAFKGGAARANRGSESRQIHFKDADSYLAYMQEFGTGSMYDAITGHIGRLARDIGLVERYGPNPNAQMKLQLDLAGRADGRDVGDLPRSFGMRPQTYWDLVNGTASSPQSARIAQVGTDARNIQVFGKLGAAVISSITDLGTYITTTGYNRLSYWDSLANIGRTATSKDARDFLTAHGVISEAMVGDLNRWTGDNIRQTWSGRLANSTMKLSLMNAWTDSLRRAFSMTMMQGLARMSRTEWGKLTEWDRALMERRGLTADDWGVMQQAEVTHFSGLDHLTPEGIRATGHERANEIVAKVLGLIQDESEFAVLNPDLPTKGLASGGATQRGTVRGELARSVMQFKSFPIAMVSRHWRRMLDAPTVKDGSAPVLANRAVYAGAMMLTTTALGAIALQAKQIIGGKDPIDMTGKHAGKFWGKAVAQGGGLSIVGDMLLNDPNDSPGDFAASTAKTFIGPAVGSALDLGLKVGVGNVWKAVDGKPTHAAADAVNWGRANTPYLGLWYAKAAVDHMGMHALQENLSPGYLGKMKQRAKKEFGQDYWWAPGTGAPGRAPNLGAAVGQ